MAYINTQTKQYPLYEQDIRILHPNTSFSEPFNPEGYAYVFSVPMPTFDSYTQTCKEVAPVLTDKGHYEQVYEVTDLTGETLAEGLARKAADEAVKLEKEEAERVSKLWQAAHDTEFAQISGSAIGLLALGVLQNKTKCLAVQGWLDSIWTEYYIRKDSGSTDYDFSFAGSMPYSVPELKTEVLGG